MTAKKGTEPQFIVGPPVVEFARPRSAAVDRALAAIIFMVAGWMVANLCNDFEWSDCFDTVLLTALGWFWMRNEC